jgi:hypothetical protein
MLYIRVRARAGAGSRAAVAAALQLFGGTFLAVSWFCYVVFNSHQFNATGVQ